MGRVIVKRAGSLLLAFITLLAPAMQPVRAAQPAREATATVRSRPARARSHRHRSRRQRAANRHRHRRRTTSRTQ
jgi:hypothetical protein